MTIQPIQIILIIFILFAISRAFLRLRDNEINTKEFLFWALVWFAVLVVGFKPELTVKLSQFVGVGRGIDLIVYMSIVFLFYLIFRIYVKIEKIDQNLTEVVRLISFKNGENSKKSKRK